MALREFAEEVEAGEDKRIVLVVDQAGGTPPARSSSPKGYTWSSYPRAHLSLCPRRGCGP